MPHPDITCPTEYSHLERINWQFCAMACHTPTFPLLLSTATLIELPASFVSWHKTPRSCLSYWVHPSWENYLPDLCYGMPHNDLASNTEYNHRERIMCQFCAMTCHTPNLLSYRENKPPWENYLPDMCHGMPHNDFASPSEYSHRERITCQFCAMECHTPTFPVLPSTTTVIYLTASSVSRRATPRPVLFLRTKRRVVVGFGLLEEFPVNIG